MPFIVRHRGRPRGTPLQCDVFDILALTTLFTSYAMHIVVIRCISARAVHEPPLRDAYRRLSVVGGRPSVVSARSAHHSARAAASSTPIRIGGTPSSGLRPPMDGRPPIATASPSPRLAARAGWRGSSRQVIARAAGVAD